MVTLKGTVVHGSNIAGRLFGTPTANLEFAHAHQLEPGVYSAYTMFDDVAMPSAVYISPEGKFEVHLFNFSRDIVGKTLEVEVRHRVSDVVSWESEEQMRKKIESDLAKVRIALNI